MLRSFYLFLFLMNWCGSAWSVIWDIPAAGLQELQVRARAAKLVVKQVEGATTVKVSVLGSKEDSWSHEILSNKVLKITGPEEGITVEDSILSLEIPAGTLVSKMGFEEVRADLQSVTKLSLTALKGKIQAHNTGEGVKLFLQKGDIQCQKNSGSLEIESFSGKVSISEGVAPIKLKLFNGELIFDKNSSALTIESQSATAKITEQTGNVSLLWGRGNFVMNDFSGRLEGTSSDGHLQIQLKPDASLDLQAQRGRVSVSLPYSSGATLNLKSVAGEMSLPHALKPSRDGRFKILRSKLPGTQKGSVAIRSEDATIIIK